MGLDLEYSDYPLAVAVAAVELTAAVVAAELPCTQQDLLPEADAARVADTDVVCLKNRYARC